MSRQPRARPSPAQWAATHPAKASRYRPVVAATGPGAREGFLSVTVSLSPGELVTIQVNAAHYAREGLGAIADVLPSLYQSTGLEADLSTRGDT